MTTESVTLESLMAAVNEAVKAGDTLKVIDLAAQMKRLKAEVAKAEAERLAKEAEALAGVRKEATEKLLKAIKLRNEQPILDLMASIKAVGFHYNYRVEGSALDIGFDYATAPKPTTKRTGGGGGNRGKSKAEYGLSLNEIFEKFATADDRTALDTAGKAETRPDSAQYTVKVAVKKRAIEAGLLRPVS